MTAPDEPGHAKDDNFNKEMPTKSSLKKVLTKKNSDIDFLNSSMMEENSAKKSKRGAASCLTM